MNTQLITFTGNGTWTCPTNAITILITGWGGSNDGSEQLTIMCWV
jgi:hypothetical protein